MVMMGVVLVSKFFLGFFYIFKIIKTNMIMLCSRAVDILLIYIPCAMSIYGVYYDIPFFLFKEFKVFIVFKVNHC